jgi:hypothetical protein
MAIALLICGTAFAAFCVWLMVRIVNRKERWSKSGWVFWTTVIVAMLLVVYPFG